jgi:hypothetical protein
MPGTNLLSFRNRTRMLSCGLGSGSSSKQRRCA